MKRKGYAFGEQASAPNAEYILFLRLTQGALKSFYYSFLMYVMFVHKVYFTGSV